jgi:hypothetical protein
LQAFLFCAITKSWSSDSASLTEPAVSGGKRVDSLHLACRTDRRGLTSQLHATTVQLVHALEISDELWD